MKFEVSIEKEKVDKTLKDLEDDVVFQNIKRQAAKIKGEKLGFARGATGLPKYLGWFDIMAITVCAVVGMGIFVNIFAVQIAVPGIGNAVPLAILVCAVPAIATALCYASLASALPRDGGDYIFISRGLSPFFGFWTSWMKWLCGAVTMGVIAYVSTGLIINLFYIIGVGQPIIDGMRSSVGYVAITLMVLGICYWINVGRWKYYKWTIRTFFFIILFGSLLIVLPNIALSPDMFLEAATWEYGGETVSSALDAGSAVADAHPFDIFDPETFVDSLIMLLSAASVLFFAYNGFGTAVAVSGETRDPRRNIPKGIISAILLITILYFVVSISYYRFIPWEFVVGYTTLHPDAQVSDFINVSPYAGEILLTSFVIMIALVSDILPWMMSISRIFFAWSFDGLMPKKFSEVNKNGMPVNALIITYIITVLTVIESEVMGIFEMLKFNTIAMLTIYTFVNITMFLLPIHRPLYYNMATFKLGRFNSLVSGIGILSAFLLTGMLIGTSFHSFIVFCILSMIGGLIYQYNYRKQLESGIDMETTFKILPPE